MKRGLIITAMVVVLGAIVVASVLSSRSEGDGTEVHLEPASRADISQIIKASGQVDPRIKVNISAHVIGKIEKLFVKEGDQVKAGQPFLRLEQEAFVANRDRAAAQVEIARSYVRQADINLEDATIRRDRARRLHTEKVIAKEGLDQAELAFKSAELTLEQARESVHQAEAELTKAQDDFKKTTIYAPLTGRVIALNAEEGEVVVSGTMNNAASVIGTIADLSEILVEVDVDENEIVFAKHGQPAKVVVDAISDRDYHGTVVEIGSSGTRRPAQPDVTIFKVKVLLEDPDDRLRAGMSARAEIEVDTHRQALSVPIQAVVYREVDDDDTAEGEEVKVVFVRRESKAVKTAVEVGLSDATRIEILAGLEATDEVVIGPYRALRNLADGERIRLKDPSDKDKAGDKKKSGVAVEATVGN